MLIDLREGNGLHGFHLLASLHLIADELGGVQLLRIGGEEATEAIALGNFIFETGFSVERWGGGPVNVYAFAADKMPKDVASLSARRLAARTVASILFGRVLPTSNFVIPVPAHDTRAISEVLAALIRT